jgi:hypothetical protein
MPLASKPVEDWREHGHHSTKSPSHGLNQIQRKHKSQLEGFLLTLVAADSVGQGSARLAWPIFHTCVNQVIANLGQGFSSIFELESTDWGRWRGLEGKGDGPCRTRGDQVDHTSNAKRKWQAATYGQPCRISQHVSRPRRVTIQHLTPTSTETKASRQRISEIMKKKLTSNSIPDRNSSGPNPLTA